MARQRGGTSRLHLQMLFSVGATSALTDGQLLERFATLQGEASELALAALIERHGRMVFRACCGILHDEHDAHDAFQATFLVLLRKGRTLWVRDSLGPWLHRVACRAAARARVESQRRRIHERRAAVEAADRRGVETAGELAAVLHEEVDRLPDRYREPIVLCDLQGRTYEEAAQHLRCPVGTVRSRLARGRERLRLRLTRRGLAPSAAVLTATLAPDTASAASPAAWVGPLGRYARGFRAGGAPAAGEVPASVLAITEGVLKMFSLSKQTLFTAGALTVLGLAIGAGVLAQQNTVKPTPAVGQAPPAVPDRRWVGTLPKGATIEVLGVSTFPTGPATWWRPDGSPLVQAPCDSPQSDREIEAGEVLRVIAARMTGWSLEDDDSDWTVDVATGVLELGEATKGGKVVPGVYNLLFAFRGDVATCSVGHSPGSSPWQTLASSDGTSSVVESTKSGQGYILGKAFAGKNGAIIAVSHTISDANVRLTAFDRAGREGRRLSASMAQVKGLHQITAEFNLGLDAIREYRLQTRPRLDVSVGGIALRPGGRN